ncbi:peptide/nickel transport system permease protein [Humitalea rosea]|uniref:Peptide/nickel transport system permease protein n=1 Tax=Humitalea rosea TaxID=990373 RepID=A0A2W7I1X3_9PROT|nr:ABC transporter permease [Humitalea rosea]PZW39442.1 peptide/nickel transport system permease protein [Humitalea rosea]
MSAPHILESVAGHDATADTPTAPPSPAVQVAVPTRRRAPLSWSMRIGLAVLVFYCAVALLSLVWTPFDPLSPGVGEGYMPPSREFLLGTDRLGSDILSRIMAGARYDLGITLVAVTIALVVGTILGTIAGYYGGTVDIVISRCVEVFQAFPGLLFAMLVVKAVGPGVLNIILVMSFIGIPDYLRLSRAEIRSRRNWPYAEAARMVGNRSWQVAFRHLLPNSAGPLLAFTSINAAFVALVTASLGFLGLGLDPNTPEWGSMIARGQDGVMTGEWWLSFFPGLAILGMTGAFYLLGDALSDLTDPRRRR